MPATMEVVCTDEECPLDMFDLHFTYDMPDDASPADFICPYCGQFESLRELTV